MQSGKCLAFLPLFLILISGTRCSAPALPASASVARTTQAPPTAHPNAQSLAPVANLATTKPSTLPGRTALPTTSTQKQNQSAHTSQSGLAPATITVTFPEGFTFRQVAERLEANGVCSAKAFYAAAQSYQVQSFATPYSRQSCFFLEGFLYPDSYDFYLDEPPTNVLRKLLNNYAAKSGLPSYDTLILASLIERETRSPAHMANVSSVFHNRLAQGMRLQADATILYVEQHLKGVPWAPYLPSYAGLYNTYKCAALPVGPICNPGRRAIAAAQNPANTPWLYYFFGKDNTNHYSKDYPEHQAAMAQYGVGR